MLISIQDRIANLSPAPRCISAEEAVKEIEQNQGLLIDVREPAECEADPVTKSVNYPRGLLEMKMLENEKDANKPIYIHCASGVRAQLAGEQLMKMGYSQVTAISCKLSDIKKHID